MKQLSFWPSVYQPNVRKHQEILEKYGNAAAVMRAEKKHIWEMLDYSTHCENQDEETCSSAVEKRHRKGVFGRNTSYKLCKKSKTGSCSGAPVNYDISLQFLRWLLSETNPTAFKDYVRKFPHQLTERNYGYNLEEAFNYLPKSVVDEIKAEHLFENVSLGKIDDFKTEIKTERHSPKQQYLSDDRDKRLKTVIDERLNECVKYNREMEQQLYEREKELQLLRDKQRNKSGEYSRKRDKALERDLDERLQEIENLKQDAKVLNDEITFLVNEQKVVAPLLGEAKELMEEAQNLRDEVRRQKKDINILKKEQEADKKLIKELMDEAAEANMYAVGCADDRVELKNLREEMRSFSAGAKIDISGWDIERATHLMKTTIAKIVREALNKNSKNVQVGVKISAIKRAIIEFDRALSGSLTLPQKAGKVILFYNEMFNRTDGLVTDISEILHN